MFDGSCNCFAFLALGAVGLYLVRKYLKGGQFTENVSAREKVAVVTGGNAGIGLETVRELNKRGAKVYVLCRNEQRAAAAIVELVKGGCDVTRLVYVNCDLGSKASVRKCATELSKLEKRIDILVNNAGIVMSTYEKTVDGHEATWGTNHLGHFLLTELLLPLIEKADEGRIVNVSSLAQAFSPVIDIATIDTKEDFDEGRSYPKSKLANVMHARDLTRRLRSRGNMTVTANSLHPGSIHTDLLRNMSIGWKLFAFVVAPMMKSVKDGAQTSLYCALSTDLKGVSGHYFSDCARKGESTLALDDLACKQLYDYSLKTVGLA